MTVKVKNKIDDMLEHNKQFVLNKEYEQYATTKAPDKKMVILACMDTRLIELLPKALGIKNGDAQIIKNAGAVIMHPFGNVVKSILLSIYEFDVEDIIIFGHHDCGANNTDSQHIIGKMLERGIDEKIISILNSFRTDIENWLEGFESVQQQVEESVNFIKTHPLIPDDIRVHGFIMDPNTGAVEVVVNGYDNY